MIHYIKYFTKYPNSILNFVISNNIIDKNTALEYVDIFTKYSVMTIITNKHIFEKNYFEKEKFDFYGMDNYFYVSIKKYQIYESNYNKFENLKKDIIDNFDVLNIRCENEFHIHKSQFEYFLNRYENNTEIYWYSLCMNKCLYFTDNIISKYNNILSWHTLQYSGNLNWNFNLIDSKKDILNWMVISSYEFLVWNFETIDKYKDYLIFSLGDNKNNNFNGSTRNLKGNSFKLDISTLQKNKFNFKLKGSISLCETISWSYEIIEKFYDYWDWEELCLNKGIKWDHILIDKYITKINFKALSSNPSVKWSIDLIQKYINHWDWSFLSNNYGINFNYEMILQFENLWHWKPVINNWYWDEYDKKENKRSLLHNKNIIWSLKIVENFYEKIDFWLISLHGIVEESVIIKYSKEFDRKEKCGWVYHKWSDFRDTEDIIKNGWENLKVNPNIKFSVSLIDFFLNYKTNIVFSEGNLAYNGVILEKEISLLELFKEKHFYGLNIELVMLNEYKWGHIFFNNDFINSYLLEVSIKEIIDKEFSLKLLEELRLMSNFKNIK